MTETTQEKVIDLLNEASLSAKDTSRVTNLKHVQELILNKEPALLDNFLEEMLQFQLDKSSEVKKCVISFIEEACKKDHEIIIKVIDNFRFLFYDENVNVQKRAYLAMINIYKNTLKWITKLKECDEETIQTWKKLQNLKDHLVAQLDSDNDGVRTASIKFMEMLICVFSMRTKESRLPPGTENDISVDQIPDDHKILKNSQIIDEGNVVMEKLLIYTLSAHISSVNLILCMTALSSIGRQRPEYMTNVLQAFEKIEKNLPPTLGKSQITSVKKQMKMLLMTIVKQTNMVEYYGKISEILTDIGVSQSEINKIIPKNLIPESRKRQTGSSHSFEAETGNSLMSKKPKISLEDDQSSEVKQSILIDVVTEDLVQKLSAQENVADLVLLTMVMLPDPMPAEFSNNYKPIAAAGTVAQIKQLARLLAIQLNNAGLCKSYEAAAKERQKEEAKQGIKHQKLAEDESTEDTKDIDMKQKVLMEQKAAMAQKAKISRAYKLSEVTKPLSKNAIESLLSSSFNRILSLGELAEKCNRNNLRKKVLYNFTSQSNYENQLMNHIFTDIHKRLDMGIQWIYNLYLNYKSDENSETRREQYERVLYSILTNLHEHEAKDLQFSKVIFEAPIISEKSISLLKTICENESRAYIGINTVKDIVTWRPANREPLLLYLLEQCYADNVEIRNDAILVNKKLHKVTSLSNEIENFALDRLKLLLWPNPPNAVITENPDESEKWTEDGIKLYLNLYLNLIPQNHALIQPLTQIFTKAPAEVKRTILRMVDQPVKEMGMQSEELLKLIEQCPKGSEALITRIIQILTDKTVPSPELVEKVRDLYVKREQDVRLLIPILSGLTKQEIISILPQLIKLPQTVVKEVFNRLLAEQGNQKRPISAAELLVSLHLIDSNVCDLRTVISATSLCMAEKQIYTPEVFMAVLQQLVEVNPIPTLFMRTVMQILAIYPKLTGFVLNIMQRLVAKQIWNYPKVWEGFIKCCQRTKQSSMHLLLQLPPVQLKDVLNSASDLKEALNKYMKILNPTQKAQVGEATLKVLEEAFSDIVDPQEQPVKANEQPIETTN